MSNVKKSGFLKILKHFQNQKKRGIGKKGGREFRNSKKELEKKMALTVPI